MDENNTQLCEEEAAFEINIFDHLITLLKHKKFIISITLIVGIITLSLTFIKTSIYRAEASIFPSTQQQSTNLTSQLLGQFGLFSGGSGGSSINSNQKLLVEIIKSRAFTDSLIEKFNLIKYYEAKDIAEAREILSNRIFITPDFTSRISSDIRFTQSPLMRISAADEDKKKAADLTNAIVNELNNSINKMAMSELSQSRLFYKEQLKQASDDLITAENEFRLFQEKTGIYEVDTQTSILIHKIADLNAQITKHEIELEVMKSYTTANNPDYQRVKETINALKVELAKLAAKESGKVGLLISSDNIPELTLEYKRLFRQLKFNETMHGVLVKQYEGAKMEEAKNAPSIQVIDYAVPPKKKKFRRKISRMHALSLTLASFFLSCLIAFLIEYHNSASKSPSYNQKICTLKKHLSFKKLS